MRAQGFSSVYRPRREGAVQFAGLLDAVASVDSEMRVRFTSPHPKDFSDEVLQVGQLDAGHRSLCAAFESKRGDSSCVPGRLPMSFTVWGVGIHLRRLGQALPAFKLPFVQVIAERSNIAKNLHMPIQSGSSAVLARMRRGYTREAYDALIDRVRGYLPQVQSSIPALHMCTA